MQKDISPFTPGSPVGVDLFAGRTQQIEEVSRYVRQASAGRQQSVFLIGDRGIGKSSFASVIRELATKKYGMLGVHIHLGGVNGVEELVRRVLQELVGEVQDKPWYNRIVEQYGPYIQQVGLFGLKIAFNPPQQDLSQIAQRFSIVLGELVAHTSDEHNGVIIVLDDINGLAETSYFARWYKSFVDEIGTHFPSYPVLVALSGTPERRDQLAQHDLSLPRVFRPVELDRLSDAEVTDFFYRAFDQAELHIDDDAVEVMVHYSSGLPVMMQEIGEAIFWVDEDGEVNRRDAIAGVITAADTVGRKYLEPRVLRALRSSRYQSIVRTMGASIEPTFTRQQIRAKLTIEERNVFDNLRRRLQDLGVIEPDIEQGRGAYRFTNQLYHVYLNMASLRT